MVIGGFVSAPPPERVSSTIVTLAMILPLLGLLIVMGICIIWKQRKAKGNYVVREPGLEGSETVAFLEKGWEEGDIEVMAIHRWETLQVGWEKTGRATLWGLILQKGSKKVQKAPGKICEFSSFAQFKIIDHASLLIN